MSSILPAITGNIAWLERAKVSSSCIASIRESLRRSSIIEFNRKFCSSAFSKNSFFVSSGMSPWAVSIYPPMDVIGVFNSWLTFATKTLLIASNCFNLVTSVITIRHPTSFELWFLSILPLTIKNVFFTLPIRISLVKGLCFFKIDFIIFFRDLFFIFRSYSLPISFFLSKSK